MHQHLLQEARLLQETRLRREAQLLQDPSGSLEPGIGDRIDDPADLCQASPDFLPRPTAGPSTRIDPEFLASTGRHRSRIGVLNKQGLDPMSRYRHASNPMVPDARLGSVETVTGPSGVREDLKALHGDLWKVRDEILKEVNEKADRSCEKISAMVEDLLTLKADVSTVASTLKQRQTEEEEAQYQSRLYAQELAGTTQQAQQQLRLEMQNWLNEMKASGFSLVRTVEDSQQKELENIDRLLRSFFEPFKQRAAAEDQAQQQLRVEMQDRLKEMKACVDSSLVRPVKDSQQKELENIDHLLRSFFEPFKQRAAAEDQAQQQLRLEMQHWVNEMKASVESSLVRPVKDSPRKESPRKELKHIDHLLRSHLEPFKQRLEQRAAAEDQAQQQTRLEMQDWLSEMKASGFSLVRSVEDSQQKELENIDHLLQSFFEPFKQRTAAEDQVDSSRKELKHMDDLLRSYLEPFKEKLDQSCYDINEKIISALAQRAAAEDQAQQLLRLSMQDRINELKLCVESFYPRSNDALVASQRKDFPQEKNLERSTVSKDVDCLSRTFDALLRRHLDTLWKVALEKGEATLRQHLSPLYQEIQKIDVTEDRLTESVQSALSSHRLEIHQVMDLFLVDADRLSKDMRNELVNQSSQISQILDNSNRQLGK